MIKLVYKKVADSFLAKGQKSKAVKWYRKAGLFEQVGDILMDLGDYEEAAELYTSIDLFEKAGTAAEKAGDPGKAAEHFLNAGDVKRAAKVLIDTGSINDAISLMVEHSMQADAALMLEQIGRKKDAARLYTELGNFEKAIALYREIKSREKLFQTYIKRGDVENGARECLDHGEVLIAASLYEFNKQYSRAAEIYADAGRMDKALSLFEKAGDYDSIAEIYNEMGNLFLAAETYEKIPDKVHIAAELYEKLLLLEKIDSRTFDKNMQCGCVAHDANAAVLCTMDRSIIYTTADLQQKWRFRLSGQLNPRSVSITADGTCIAVGTDGPIGENLNTILMINDKKEILWQAQFEEPPKDLVFMPDKSGVIAAIGDQVSRFDMEGKEIWARTVDFKAWTLDLSPDDSRVIAGTVGGSLYMFDLEGNDIRDPIKIGDRVHTIRFLPDGKGIIVARGSNIVAHYNLSLEKVWEFEGKEICRRIEFFPGRDAIVSISDHDITMTNIEGSTIYTSHFDERILSCFPGFQQKMLYVALDNNTIQRFASIDCKIKAAECYTSAGNKLKAAEIYRSVERYDDAYELFKEIGDFENAASTLHLIGDIRIAARHYELVEKYEKAARLYEEAEEIHLAAKCYGKAGLYLEAARLYEQMEDFLLAADFYERAGQYKQAGMMFGSIDQSQKAISNFEAHYEEHPDDQEAIFELGKFYKKEERFDDAIKMLQQVIDNEDFGKEALQNLGQCFLQKKIYDVALNRFQECLGEDTKASRNNIDIYYDIGCTYEQKGDYDKAKEVFGEVMAIDYYYKDIQDRLNTSEEMSMLSRSRSKGGEFDQIVTSHEAILTQKPVVRYKIIKKLGEGGMGVVYLARDSELNREVAWKILPPALAGDEEFRKRLINEARAAAKLSHHNIVSIYDIVMTDTECSIIMEYINGTTLRHITRQKKKLPVSQVIRYGLQIADALVSAHKSGVVHRDLKPENIMITSDGDEVKVVDFGLARLGDEAQMTREGCILGTIPYMAPEQIMAREIGPHTDIYALGVLFFEMLAGRHPFIGENILAQHLQNTPPDLREFCDDVPPVLFDCINCCLEKEPEKRPKSCADIVTSLRGV